MCVSCITKGNRIFFLFTHEENKCFNIFPTLVLKLALMYKKKNSVLNDILGENVVLLCFSLKKKRLLPPLLFSALSYTVVSALYFRFTVNSKKFTTNLIHRQN